MTKIGLIGAGRWSTPYALSAKLAGVEISGIYTPDTSGAKLADRMGSVAADDPRALIERSDAVLIGSPTDTHRDYLEMAARAGKPALCASPVVPDANEADRLEVVAGKGVYASLPLRARPEYRRLHDAVKGGDLGQIGVYRLGTCRPHPGGWREEEKRSGGMLMELGIHLVDALEWLGGGIDRIYGAQRNVDDKEYVVMVARLKEGSIAHLEVSWAEPDGVSYDYYEVSGSQGLLEYDSRREPLLVVDYHDDRATDVLSPGATAAEHELREFVRVLGGEPGAVPTLAEGLKRCHDVVKLKGAIQSGGVLTLG